MSVLDFILTITFLPFSACQRIYENDHLMIMLRVIFEVSLELIMWLVLAGVSILTSAALIFDDLYCGKSGSEGYRRLVKNYNETANDRGDDSETDAALSINDQDAENSPKENESPRETIEESKEIDNRRWLSSPYPKNWVPNTAPKNSQALNSHAVENNHDNDDDELSINFSFYKPLRHDFKNSL